MKKNQKWKRENLFLVGHIRGKKKGGGGRKSHVSINKCIKLKEQWKQVVKPGGVSPCVTENCIKRKKSQTI